MTDQPPSQQPAEEPEGDEPAALVPDDAPTEVRPAEPVEAAPEPVAAPEPPAAFAPADAPAPPPPPLPPVADAAPAGELPSGDGGLAAAFPSDRPERAVSAAFAAGLVLALILKRLAR